MSLTRNLNSYFAAKVLSGPTHRYDSQSHFSIPTRPYNPICPTNPRAQRQPEKSHPVDGREVGNVVDFGLRGMWFMMRPAWECRRYIS